MKQIFIQDIRPGDRITEFFALRKADLLEKDGQFRLSMELGDSTGRIQAVIWEATRESSELYKPGRIVKIKGVVGSYRDKPQLRVEKIRPAREDEYDLVDFFRACRRSRDELSGVLDSMIEKVENSYLRKLLDTVFGDKDIRQKYLTSPAAKLLHHDVIGGLADHSLSVAEIVIRLTPLYPALNRDILICAALLHDIGKIWEFEVSAAIDYSDAGRLIGHISQGDEYVTRIAGTIEQFPPDTLTHLRHLILSHQGEKENGSPVLPMTPEAMFLHQADNLDARMGAVDKIRERTENDYWSQYMKIFERYFYFGYETREPKEAAEENNDDPGWEEE